MKYRWIQLAVFELLLEGAVGIDPISIGFIGAAIYGYYTYQKSDTAKDYVHCITGYECCQSGWIQFQLYGLMSDMKQHVFGQHIAKDIVPAAIKAFSLKSSNKPLVMSFHGWPGGGKNYVATFIAKNYFKKGVESKYFHFFSARSDFPLESEVNKYKITLVNKIRDSVRDCPRSMFVFDEIEKMPAGVLDVIKPFLDHHPNVGGIDFRKAIFLFLSNIGGTLITERYLELWRKQGKARAEMTINDFDIILGKGAFNERGGFQMSDIVDHNLIDHYVPFLPLERHHVEKCITAEMDRWNFPHKEDIIEEVMKSVVFGPSPEALFSHSGCKRLSQKVSALIEHDFIKKEYDNKSS